MDPPPEARSGEAVTLCMVVHNRVGNLANALHSVGQIDARIVVVNAGGGGGRTVEHLASEYDAVYLQAPDDPDESVLLNTALEQAATLWALFLREEEVLHLEGEVGDLRERLRSAEAIAFDLPIIHLSEPNSHHLECRLIRTDVGLCWSHNIYPSLGSSLARAADQRRLERPVVRLPLATIASLGDPELEEWELRDAIVRIEQELDKDPAAVRYWYHLAETAWCLQEWDRVHLAIEEGLQVISQRPETSGEEPLAVNGLIARFCEFLLGGHYYPEKTVDSLFTIFRNMAGDGRLSVPLGRLLLAIERKEDAVDVQYKAVAHFFNDRRYYLSPEEGLFKPIQMIWEIEAQHSNDDLLTSVVKVQTQLSRFNYQLQPVLQHLYKHNQSLFSRIQNILQTSLRTTG